MVVAGTTVAELTGAVVLVGWTETGGADTGGAATVEVDELGSPGPGPVWAAAVPTSPAPRRDPGAPRDPTASQRHGHGPAPARRGPRPRRLRRADGEGDEGCDEGMSWLRPGVISWTAGPPRP